MLVFAWDGVGYGADGTLWGGEAFLGRPGAVAAGRELPALPAAGRRARRPRALAQRGRAVLGTGFDWPACPDRDGLARGAWERGLNTPWTSAVGRLFDAAAALTGVCLHASYEGEGPMRLEAAACRAAAGGHASACRWPRTPKACCAPTGRRCSRPLPTAPDPVGERAALLHECLASTAVAMSYSLARRHAIAAVGATGGVMQNRRLADRMQALFAAAGRPGAAARLPANDACIAFGQVIEQAAADPPGG
jgi:hydrogenase maturation protein HypF